MDKPKTIEGKLFCDARGRLLTWNEYNPTQGGIKRSYVVKNRENGYIRAFHFHQFEEKYIRVVQGAALFVYYHPTDIKTGDCNGEYQKIVLDSDVPQVLYLPPNTAHGFKTLEENTLILVDSTFTLEQSKADDYRYEYNILGTYADVWEKKFY